MIFKSIANVLDWLGLKPKSPGLPLPTAVRWDETTIRVFAKDRKGPKGAEIEIESLRWSDLVSVRALKQDCFGTDRIWVGFDIAGSESAVYIHEECEGYPSVIDEMQRRCPGYRQDWWKAVAFPAFEQNHTWVWERAKTDSTAG